MRTPARVRPRARSTQRPLQAPQSARSVPGGRLHPRTPRTLYGASTRRLRHCPPKSARRRQGGFGSGRNEKVVTEIGSCLRLCHTPEAELSQRRELYQIFLLPRNRENRTFFTSPLDALPPEMLSYPRFRDNRKSDPCRESNRGTHHRFARPLWVCASTHRSDPIAGGFYHANGSQTP